MFLVKDKYIVYILLFIPFVILVFKYTVFILYASVKPLYKQLAVRDNEQIIIIIIVTM